VTVTVAVEEVSPAVSVAVALIVEEAGMVAIATLAGQLVTLRHLAISVPFREITITATPLLSEAEVEILSVFP
jgi:hypothetical protein